MMSESESDVPEPSPEQVEEASELAEQSTRDLEKMFKFVFGHRVRHDEVGAQGVMTSGAWLDVLQVARTEYFRHLGLFIEGAEAPVQILVRRVVIDHLAVARYDQPLLVRMRCARIGETSLQFAYLIDDADGLRMAVAETVMTCVELDPIRSMSWPFTIRERVLEFEGPSLLDSVESG